MAGRRRAVRLLAVASLIGCQRPGTSVNAANPSIHVIGSHSRARSGALRIAWPATQAEFSMRGRSVSVELEDTPVPDDKPETDRVLVLLDDKPERELALRVGVHTYELASGLSDGNHHVKLWKQTEGDAGTIELRQLMIRGSLVAAPPSLPARTMLEAIGDSITVGYGNAANGVDCATTTTETNSYDAYAAVAARRIGADYRAFAFSGKGLTRNYNQQDDEPLPVLYERVLPFEAQHAGITSPPADYVVINVGTNDFFRGVPEATSWRSALHALTLRVRQRNPSARLVLALGPLLSDDYPVARARSILRGWLQDELERLRREGHLNVAFIEFWIDPAEGLGCQYHPSARTHARLGAELAALLKPTATVDEKAMGDQSGGED